MPAASLPSASSLSGTSFPSPAAVALPAARRPTRSLHLAAAIDGLERYEAAAYVELAKLAEGGALDFVTLDDARLHPGGAPGPDAVGGGRLDALAILARIAPATGRIGVIPSVTAARTEAHHVCAAVDTLDWVSRGRAGWNVKAERAAVRPRWQEVEEVAEAVERGWDSRTATTWPRPPQNRPVTAVDATEPGARRTAARHADIAFVRASGPEQAGRIRAELRRLAAGAGRDPDRLLVLAELSVDLGGGELGPEPGAQIVLAPDGAGGVLFSGGPVDLADLIGQWQRAGAVDGFHVRPVEPRRDLERFVNGTAALLQHRGLFRAFHPGATLREHLGLHRPPRRLAAAEGAAS